MAVEKSAGTPSGYLLPRHWRAALSRTEWRSVAGMATTIVLLHVVGWGVLAGVVAPREFALGSAQVFGVGLGLTAYTLGMRHAFDADHIAAIDNTTRTLMGSGTRPLSVGFWFSLGHSSVVFALVGLLAIGFRTVAEAVGDDSSSLQQVMSVVGSAVSGSFLCLIAAVNLVMLIGVVRVFRRVRRGSSDSTLPPQLGDGGLLSRILARVTRTATRPWQMYPIGVLFGLGFDTATEVALLVLAGGAAAVSLPWYAVLTLPVLFAAGMTLLDTIDGCFMTVAYGRAFADPLQKLRYSITVTGLSVAVALIIGTAKLLSIPTGRAGDQEPPGVLAQLDSDYLGYAIVALFVLVWAGWLGLRPRTATASSSGAS